jgi:Zn-dependent protease
MFGWAKPVPFNPYNLRDRRMGEIAIAFAGPLSNFLLAAIFALLYKIIFQTSLLSAELLGELTQPVYTLVNIGITLNIILGVFNLIPIPPLDGHHILRNLLPDSLADLYAQIPSWMGFVLLFLLVRAGITGMLVQPVFQLVDWFLR